MPKLDVSEKAGAVFYLLEQENSLSVKEIYEKMNAQCSEKQTLLALGWLARDNRILFYNENDELYVKVNGIPMTEIHS